jgi:hypothetical protein
MSLKVNGQSAWLLLQLNPEWSVFFLCCSWGLSKQLANFLLTGCKKHGQQVYCISLPYRKKDG